jgi:alpha-D-ribose 1-methylphosphonate 5-triphosphate synthase subunit PhnH
MQEQKQALDGGFAEPVFGAQATFRALMDALANPGQVQALSAPLESPAGLAPELAAVALTMCDHDTNVWLDPDLMESEAVLAWLRFHTAAPLTTDPSLAQFALVSSADALPALEQFALGTDQYPDRSTTIALSVPSLTGGTDLTLRGPGIDDHMHISPQGLPSEFLAQWANNRGEFPRGVDLLLVSGSQVLGLPRTTRITMEAH